MKYSILSLTVAIFLFACDPPVKKCTETRDLPIIPTVCIGPYKLGISEQELISILCPEFDKKISKALFNDNVTTYYFIENMSFVFRHNRLQEIYVWGSFSGTYDNVIDVDYSRDILEEYGEVIEHNGEYRILDVPKIAFGLENHEGGKYIRIFE